MHFSQQTILQYLEPDHPYTLEVHALIDSTSTRAKALAADGAPAWTAVLADAQSAGRGRLDRSFFSPAGGLYLSVLLRPETPFSQVGFFTAAAAVAVCRAIYGACKLDCAIKWPNDILLRGKKVGGILAETVIGENGVISSMVIGVGLNLTPPENGFPPALSRAGALYETGADDSAILRDRLAASLLTQLHRHLAAPDPAMFMEEYVRRSEVLGKDISVVRENICREAVATHIGERAELCVRYADGSTEALTYGEVSIREI